MPTAAPSGAAKIVAAFGGFWEWAPWIYILGQAALAGGIKLGWFPESLQMMATIGAVLFKLFILFWTGVDCAHRGISGFWVLGVFCCDIFGLLAYMIFARGD